MSEQEHVQDAEMEDQTVFKPYNFSALMLVRSAQGQNGLRHSDYRRYHQFCVRKLHRLRKILNFQHQGGNKLKQKQEYKMLPVTPLEAKLSDKYLHLMVFKCEADWAFAMNMKQAVSKQETAQNNSKQEESKAGLKNQSLLNQKDPNMSRNTFRLKAHSRKRFRAAFENAQVIEKLIEEDVILDSFSKMDLQAYTLSMKAVYLMENEKWQDALDDMLTSKLIYTKVSSYKDSLEGAIYLEKINQLDTFIRLCCLNLKISSAASEEAKLADKVNKQVTTAYQQTKQDKIENIEQISFNGKNIPLKSDRLKTAFKKVENQLEMINDPANKDNKEQI